MVDYLDLMMAHSVKNLPQCTRPGSVPVSARSLGEGKDYSLQYSCLEISMDKGASVQFSHSVVSNSLQPHGLQHTRLPCPSPTPRACSNSCPLSLMSSNHLFLCHPLLFLPSVFPSIRVFSSESALRIRWPKYWPKYQLQHQSF